MPFMSENLFGFRRAARALVHHGDAASYGRRARRVAAAPAAGRPAKVLRFSPLLYRGRVVRACPDLFRPARSILRVDKLCTSISKLETSGDKLCTSSYMKTRCVRHL